MAIQILAPDVVGRIAAGEVLDRPANLIKELVENSLDAKADQIDIEFAEGGRQVCVRDNGEGIEQSELHLAFERHATSKIVYSEDLFHLHSFGFRGEAIASIAAVSRLKMISRRRGSAQGYQVQCEFGRLTDRVPVSSLEGTEVRVEELFTNVPARLKFLKSEPAEHGQIKNTIKALAMAHEAVGFSVRCKGQLLFHWPKNQTFRERALAVLEVDNLFPGSFEIGGMRAEVLVSSPQDTSNVNRNMWFFVQNRWIQDRSLTAAVMEAYRNLLMHGEYPTVLARLTVPSEDVDVNVHPAKTQVKFRDSQTAFRVTSRAVRQVLESAPWLEHAPTTQEVPAFRLEPSGDAPQPTTMSFKAEEFHRTQYNQKSFPISEIRNSLNNYVAEVPTTAFRWADLQIIGQLNQTYIVAQTQDAFYLVDQHAAHERVVFERLMESFKAGKIEVQNLLLPLVFDFSSDEVETLVRHREHIERLGLVIERMGPESVGILAIPMIVKESAVSEALRRLAYEMSENLGDLAWEKSIAEVFASLACHSVIRAGQALSVEEMKSLLIQMDQYPLSSFCPHGRPVFLKRLLSQIEREFGRIV